MRKAVAQISAGLYVFLYTLFFPIRAFAQADDLPCGPDEIITDLGCVPENPIGFVERIYAIGIGIIGLVGLLFLVIGGVYILTSRGDPEKLRTGKSYILYSIIGLLLAIFGFVFIEVVAGDILRIPGIN